MGAGSSVGANSSSEEAKELGDFAFKHEKYIEAVFWYSHALDQPGADISKAILYGNRSAAYHKLQLHDRSLNDGFCAIQLDRTWAKGYYRAAKAAHACGLEVCMKNNVEKMIALSKGPTLLDDLGPAYREPRFGSRLYSWGSNRYVSDYNSYLLSCIC